MSLVFDFSLFSENMLLFMRLLIHVFIPWSIGVFLGIVYLFNMLLIPWFFGFGNRVNGAFVGVWMLFVIYIFAHLAYFGIIWTDDGRCNDYPRPYGEKFYITQLIQFSKGFKWFFIVTSLATPLIINIIGLASLFQNDKYTDAVSLWTILYSILAIIVIQGGFLLISFHTVMQPEQKFVSKENKEK